ncbi:hypothetical protein E4U42_001851, partial [Claviceps africana]
MAAAQALTQILPQMIAVSKAMAAAQNLFSTIDRVSNMDTLSEDGIEPADFQGHIRLQGVGFSYPARPNTPVLQDVNLEIRPNQVTAIVGASGSGKSTIFGLIERWYAYSSGEMTLDGHRLESIKLRWLRTKIRLVQQEPTLFSGSIYQNVMDGLAGCDDGLSDGEKKHRVVAACKAVLMHDFIAELPRGYDSCIGERGASLSGGQRQRLVIARAIVSDPKVLLLDEATSALDAHAEKAVQAALNNIARGRTVVVIAHRLSTVRDSDNIIVLGKGGRVMESGTHARLVALGGAYASLARTQDLAENMPDPVEGEEGSVASGEEEERAVAAPDVDSAQTPTARRGSGSGSGKKGESRRHGTLSSYGLLHGLFLIIKEQRTLWRPLSVTLVCCTAGGLLSSSMAVVVANSLEVYRGADFDKARFFAIMFFAIGLCSILVYATIGWISNVIAQTIIRFYRRDILDNTLRQDMAFFDRPENNTGALVARLASEPLSLQELLSFNVSLVVISIVNAVCGCTVAVISGWKLGLAMCLGAMPVIVGAGYLRIRLEVRFEQDTARSFASSSAVAAEAVMGIRTVCSLALEEAVVERYSQSLQDLVRDSIGGLGVKAFLYALSQSASLLVMGLGFWYGGRLVSTGEYTLRQFYVVYMVVIYSGGATAALFQHTTSISKACTAINYILGLRQTRVLLDDDDAEEDEDHDPGAAVARPVDEKGPGLEAGLERVHFAYPLRPKQKVLRGIDMSIRPGQMTALVGASGCGKSTLIGLLERFYDPSSGTVWVRDDGRRRDIRTLHRRRHRRDVALVQQEPVLYQGSILDNVALGIEHDRLRPADPPEARIEAACRAAHIWDFIA